MFEQKVVWPVDLLACWAAAEKTKSEYNCSHRWVPIVLLLVLVLAYKVTALGDCPSSRTGCIFSSSSNSGPIYPHWSTANEMSAGVPQSGPLLFEVKHTRYNKSAKMETIWSSHKGTSDSMRLFDHSHWCTGALMGLVPQRNVSSGCMQHDSWSCGGVCFMQHPFFKSIRSFSKIDIFLK